MLLDPAKEMKWRSFQLRLYEFVQQHYEHKNLPQYQSLLRDAPLLHVRRVALDLHETISQEWLCLVDRPEHLSCDLAWMEMIAFRY